MRDAVIVEAVRTPDMRDNGIRYGLQATCEGGGQANATILELR
jgi:acetyl-CoA acetyltransferase